MTTKQDTRTDRPSVTPERLAERRTAHPRRARCRRGRRNGRVRRRGRADHPASRVRAPPPSVAAVGAVTGTWQVDRRISALWTNPSPRNAWLHVVGLGWRKVSPATDSSVIAMTAIGSLARQTNARVDFVEESDGTISQLTIW